MKKRSNKVIFSIFIIIALVSALLIANIFSASIMGKHLRSGISISDYGKNANIKTSPLIAKRGQILDARNNVIAEDVTSYNLYAVLDKSRKGIGGVPAFVVDKDETAQSLSKILGGSKQYFLQQLSQDQYQTEFGPYGKDLPIEVKKKIEKLELPGLEFTPSTKRHYPMGEFASHLIGFSSLDQKSYKQVGRMGLEELYDEYLQGENGYDKHQVSTNGFRLPNSSSEIVEAKDGSDLYLTLDKPVQLHLEEALAKTLAYPHVNHAWGLLMDVESGKVLATGNHPTFNPEVKEITDYMFYPAQFTFEPGSTMKAFTYAAAINEGRYQGDLKFNSQEAYLRAVNKSEMIRVSKNDYYDAVVQNAYGKSWGEMSFDKGFALSSNVAIVELLMNHINTDILEEYLDRFGFFKKVGLDGFKEEAGVKSYEYAFDKFTNGFGQGSTVTMLQMVQAYGAILNNGKMMKPYVLEQIVDANEEIVYQAEPQVVGRPIKKETAQKIQDLMYRVVNDKYASGTHYRVDEIEFIAKTGTAQLIEDGKYSDTRLISSIAVGMPAKNPKYLLFYAHDGHVANLGYEQAAPIRDLIVNIANEYDLIEQTSEVAQEEIKENIKVSKMPLLNNHSLDYAHKKLEKTASEIILIGDGHSIIEQYPQANHKILSGQKVILKTSGNKIMMPDMSGWSRKEVSAFWAMSGAAVTIKGFGNVIKQSVPEGTLIYPETKIKVELK